MKRCARFLHSAVQRKHRALADLRPRQSVASLSSSSVSDDFDSRKSGLFSDSDSDSDDDLDEIVAQAQSQATIAVDESSMDRVDQQNAEIVAQMQQELESQPDSQSSSSSSPAPEVESTQSPAPEPEVDETEGGRYPPEFPTSSGWQSFFSPASALKFLERQHISEIAVYQTHDSEGGNDQDYVVYCTTSKAPRREAKVFKAEAKRCGATRNTYFCDPTNGLKGLHVQNLIPDDWAVVDLGDTEVNFLSSDARNDPDFDDEERLKNRLWGTFNTREQFLKKQPSQDAEHEEGMLF